MAVSRVVVETVVEATVGAERASVVSVEMAAVAVAEMVAVVSADRAE